jgi:hypothetical protein
MFGVCRIGTRRAASGGATVKAKTPAGRGIASRKRVLKELFRIVSTGLDQRALPSWTASLYAWHAGAGAHTKRRPWIRTIRRFTCWGRRDRVIKWGTGECLRWWPERCWGWRWRCWEVSSFRINRRVGDRGRASGGDLGRARFPAGGALDLSRTSKYPQQGLDRKSQRDAGATTTRTGPKEPARRPSAPLPSCVWASGTSRRYECSTHTKGNGNCKRAGETPALLLQKLRRPPTAADSLRAIHRRGKS